MRITKPFYLGKYLVTQEQWEAVMGSNPSHFKGPKNPVEKVSWDDCQQFLEKLNAKSAAGEEVPVADGGPVGICLPGGEQDEVLLRGRRKVELGEYAWYDAELGQHDASCWREEAERLGALRHARERMGVVPGLV